MDQLAVRRSAMACTNCRGRKIRCQQVPGRVKCENCERRDIPCVYRPVADPPNAVPTTPSVPDTVQSPAPHLPHQNAPQNATHPAAGFPSWYENGHYHPYGHPDPHDANGLLIHAIQPLSNPAPDNQYRGLDPYVHAPSDRGHPSSRGEFPTGNQFEFSPSPSFSGDQHTRQESVVYPLADTQGTYVVPHSGNVHRDYGF